MTRGWHPFRYLREHFPDWTVRYAELPGRMLGGTDTDAKTIWIDSRLQQAARRWTATHESIHAERGDVGPCNRSVECSVDREAARRLIDIHELADAILWAHHLDEIAAELWVPRIAVIIRLEALHPAERSYLDQRWAMREHTA